MLRFATILATVLQSVPVQSDSCVFWPSDAGVTVRPMGKAKVSRLDGGDVLAEVPPEDRWSGIVFALESPVDFSAWRGMSVHVSNRTDRTLTIECHAKTPGVGGKFLFSEVEVPAFAGGEIRMRPSSITVPDGVVIEGLRGYDVTCNPGGFDVHRVGSFTVFYRSVGKPAASFSVSRIEAVGSIKLPESVTATNFFPFCDRYGQFKHLEWRGKVHSDGDLAAARASEERWLARHVSSPIPDADRFGGWAKGPSLKATGYFRTEKVGGKWWLVDPDGHLFFSQGIDGVRAHDAPGVTGRERFFEWLPKEDDGVFAECWQTIGFSSNVGFYKTRFPYRTFSFATANQIRKYGKDWRSHTFADLSHRRLKAWGINTVGNWSDDVVKRAGRTPYTDTFRTRSRVIGGTAFPDPFAPEFATHLAEDAARRAKASGDDPWCLGWFVDNELDWGSQDDHLAKAVARAADGQPAKAEFLRLMRVRHGETFRADQATPEELIEFNRVIADRYFSSVRAAIKKVAPNRLYLGCRFSSGGYEVWRAAARHCDVVSVNTYRVTPTHGLPPDSEDKPILIGEFHFGALDRGMLHAGLVPAISQEERAERYKAYVRYGLGDAHIVGTHWFIWRDQPLAGRSDGEGFQIGFVDVADRPYPEMVHAAIELAGELYPSLGSKRQQPKPASGF